MIGIESLKGIDIYLIDQLMKGRIKREHLILDAGCGSGRNLIPFARQGYQIEGLDVDAAMIEQLKCQVDIPERVSVSTIEDFSSNSSYDFIICNAVLHFANSHDHFNSMFENLASLLTKNGVLFIRMTSDIGQENQIDIGNGRFLLPDGSKRYLVSRKSIDEMCHTYGLTLIEPVKSLNVDGLRVMTTIVMSKNY